jgi:hypothetical protein
MDFRQLPITIAIGYNIKDGWGIIKNDFSAQSGAEAAADAIWISNCIRPMDQERY